MSKALPIAVAVILGGVALVPVYYAAQHPADSTVQFESHNLDLSKNSSELDKLSYAQGFKMGAQIPAEVNAKAMAAGMLDAAAKKPSRFSEAEIKKATALINKEMFAKGIEELRLNLDKIPPEQKAQAEQAIKAYDANMAFMKENAKKAGVITTETGLQYKITKQGTGKQPTADSTVVAHYKGSLIDGTVFDSSFERNQPIDIPLGQVVPGWTEGFQHLKEGSTATLYIPSYLGYGEQAQANIPPFSTLIFDVELIKVK